MIRSRGDGIFVFHYCLRYEHSNIKICTLRVFYFNGRIHTAEKHAWELLGYVREGKIPSVFGELRRHCILCRYILLIYYYCGHKYMHAIVHDEKRFNNGQPVFRDRVITVKTKSVSDPLLLYGISLLRTVKIFRGHSRVFVYNNRFFRNSKTILKNLYLKNNRLNWKKAPTCRLFDVLRKMVNPVQSAKRLFYQLYDH